MEWENKLFAIFITSWSIFTRNTDNNKNNDKNQNKTSVENQCDSETIFHKTAAGDGIFNIKPFNAIWPQMQMLYSFSLVPRESRDFQMQ